MMLAGDVLGRHLYITGSIFMTGSMRKRKPG
jgi:hypothetical protein